MPLQTIVIFPFIFFATISFSQSQDTLKGHLQVSQEAGIAELQNQYVKQNQADGSISGFRVQIYNGSKAETLKKRSQFIGSFPRVPVYTLYEAPEYKLQAGDFRTRLEAEKFLQKVQNSMGGGLIVKTNINPTLESK